MGCLPHVAGPENVFEEGASYLTLASRGGLVKTGFPELLENAQSQRADILAMDLNIQGRPDGIWKIFGSDQSTDL